MLKIKIYGGLAVFFLLIIGAGYLVVYSPLFHITRINADGTQINANDLIENLKEFLKSQSKIAGFLSSENILIWKQEKISEFLKNYPQIAELNIEKDYFERTIKIDIKEREKYGIWCQSAVSNCFWFDKKGIIFAEAPMVEGALINKVEDLTGRDLKIGDTIIEQRFLDNLLKIFAVLDETNLGKGFLNLENLSLQEIIFESPDRFKIYFSLRFDPAFSVAGIKSLRETGLEKMNYIDFRVENRVYYK